MPASHRVLSNWYLQLASHLEAGSPLAEALECAGGPPAQGRMLMAARIQAGETIEAVMAKAPSWIPKADRVFICTAMETGRLPQTLRQLSGRHDAIGATQLKVVLGLLYPVAVFHLAALILPIVRMIDYEAGFEWDARQHILQSSALIFPVWGLIALILFLVKTNNPLLPRILRCIPLLRAYSKAQAMADFSFSLGTFINAGVTMQPAWRESAKVSGDPGINRAYRALAPVFAAGEDPLHQLKRFKVFPPDFVAFYSAGAKSGKLDETLIKAGRQLQDRANRFMTFAAILYPTLLFAVVAGFIIYAIFQVYGGYLDGMMKVME